MNVDRLRRAPARAEGTPRPGGPGRWLAARRRHGAVAGGIAGARGRAGPRWGARAEGSGPLRRGREDGLVGGVAAGLAARTGLDVTVVRLALVLAGPGDLRLRVAAYVLAWLLVPVAGEDSSIAARAMTDRRGIALAAGLASLLVVVLVIASALGASWLGAAGLAADHQPWPAWC